METLLLKKYFYKGDQWKMRVLKIMNSPIFSKFCCFFALRQGVISIAILESTITFFVLFLFLLGASHAQDIFALTSSDLDQLENPNWIESNLNKISDNTANNEIKLLRGRHLALAIMLIFCTGFIFSFLHLISCLLLLYGAIHNYYRCLLPWALTTALNLILTCLLFLVMAYFIIPKCANVTLLLGFCFFSIEFYFLFIVCGYYYELKF